MEGVFIIIGAGLRKTIKEQYNTLELEIESGVTAPSCKAGEQQLSSKRKSGHSCR